MKIQEIEVKTVLTKSNLPVSDYAVNAYVGCLHACKYCYASFMKRFTGHQEPWGTFLDVKNWPEVKDPSKYRGKELFLSSVTDPYQPHEAKYQRPPIPAALAWMEARMTLAVPTSRQMAFTLRHRSGSEMSSSSGTSSWALWPRSVRTWPTRHVRTSPTPSGNSLRPSTFPPSTSKSRISLENCHSHLLQGSKSLQGALHL